MKRVADIIANVLANNQINDVFMVTGGGAMHLNDAFGRHKELKTICCHHEQSLTMAAESYFRLSGKVAAVNVTTGPGGINALNGVFGAYTDSCAMVVISGQVKRETMSAYASESLRQLGDQEARITDIVKPIVKHSIILDDPEKAIYEVEKAIYIAKTGRPGPVWIDVPMDIQGAYVDENKLLSFVPPKNKEGTEAYGALEGDKLSTEIDKIIEKLHQSKRPVILAGSGVRLSESYTIFHEVINKLGIPVTTAWNAHDVIEDDHNLYVGRPGSVGNRAGNFSVQSSDLLIVLGSRLNIRQISYNWKAFAPNAYKIMIDIDKEELNKPTLSIDHSLHADLFEFLNCLNSKLDKYKRSDDHHSYLNWCRERKEKYPVVLPEYYKKENGFVNPYVFVDLLFRELKEDDIIVTGDGTAGVCTPQAADIKKNQRLYSNSGSASMGYDLPAAIGAHYANPEKRIICITGDGSIMMNLQELQIITGNKLPIKVFLLNNDGYHSIRQTQQNFFKDNPIGCGPESDLTFPDFTKIANAFNFETATCKTEEDTVKAIQKTLSSNEPFFCEVFVDKAQQFSPKLSSRRLDDGTMVTSSLEDMAPFLSREELSLSLIHI